MVALDVTDKLPLTRGFLQQIDRCKQFRPARLAAAAWALAADYIEAGGYYFWDTLTAAAVVDADILTTERVKLEVVVDGKSQGRTVETESGVAVDLGVDAKREAVEKLFIKTYSC